MVAVSDANLEVVAKDCPPSRPPRFFDAVLLTSSQISKWSLRLVFVVIVARSLGPSRFGQYALIFALIELLAIASGSGYADYLTREAARNPGQGWRLAGRLVPLRIAIALPEAALGYGLLVAFHTSHAVVAGTEFMALTLVPRAFSEAVQGVLRGLCQYGRYLAIDVVLGAALVAGACVLQFRHAGPSAAIEVEIVAAFAAGLASMAFAPWREMSRSTGLNPRQILKSSAVFNVYSFISCLYDRFDVVLLARLAGDFATGIYSVAYRALGATQLLATGVLYSLLPALSQNPQGEHERQRIESAMGFLLSAAYGIILATTVLSGPAVHYLLGNQYSESASALRILIWAVALRYMNYSLNMTILAARQERVFVVTSIVCLSVNTLGNLLLIPIFSWRAAAYLTIATELTLLVQNLYWERRIYGRLLVPRNFAYCSTMFAVLILIACVSESWRVSPWIGAFCLAAFGIHLFSSGTFENLTSVWEQKVIRPTN